MSNKPLNISDEARVQMPMKTVASLIAMVAIGTWAYFGIIETQNKLSTQVELMSKDLTENTEFRINKDDFVVPSSFFNTNEPVSQNPTPVVTPKTTQVIPQTGLTRTETALLSPGEQIIRQRTRT